AGGPDGAERFSKKSKDGRRVAGLANLALTLLRKHGPSCPPVAGPKPMRGLFVTEPSPMETPEPYRVAMLGTTRHFPATLKASALELLVCQSPTVLRWSDELGHKDSGPLRATA